MTNVTAVIFTTIVTNWAYVGTFTPRSGAPMDVQVANLQTNTIAVFVYEGNKYEKELKVERGPDLPGERRVPRPFPSISVGGGSNQMIYPPLPK